MSHVTCHVTVYLHYTNNTPILAILDVYNTHYVSLSLSLRTSSNANILPILQESESEGEVGEFHPPSQPPSKTGWESDSSTRVCRVCKQVYFNIVSPFWPIVI